MRGGGTSYLRPISTSPSRIGRRSGAHGLGVGARARLEVRAGGAVQRGQLLVDRAAAAVAQVALQACRPASPGSAGRRSRPAPAARRARRPAARAASSPSARARRFSRARSRLGRIALSRPVSRRPSLVHLVGLVRRSALSVLRRPRSGPRRVRLVRRVFLSGLLVAASCSSARSSCPASRRNVRANSARSPARAAATDARARFCSWPVRVAVVLVQPQERRHRGAEDARFQRRLRERLRAAQPLARRAERLEHLHRLVGDRRREQRAQRDVHHRRRRRIVLDVARGAAAPAPRAPPPAAARAGRRARAPPSA